MKLSKREQIMLAILGILVVVASFYIFFLKPKLEELDRYKREASDLQQKVESTKTDFDLELQVEKNYKKLYEKINAITQEFYPSIEQEKIIVTLDKFFKKTNVTGNTINFSKLGLSEVKERGITNRETEENQIDKIVNDYYNKKDKLNTGSIDKKTSEREVIKLESMSTTLYISGKYEECIDLVSEIQKHDKRIIIKNLNLVKDEENNTLAGSMILQMYAIPTLILQNGEYYKWEYNREYGKDNPFLGNSTYIEKNIKDNLDDYDFSMTVKPISADMPTVILGRMGDSSRESYVYADNIGVEPVKITLKKENNKYLYRYDTSGESFPKGQGVYNQFVPNGDNIDIRIYSIKRNSSSDVSGTKITIDNLTEKNVIVDILNDDIEKPRVNIITQNGSVMINRD